MHTVTRSSASLSFVALSLLVSAAPLAGCSAASGAPDNETVGTTNSAVTTEYGVDYSFSRPSIDGIKDHGYKFVARYVSGGGGKDLTRGEADELIAAGLDIVVVWEAEGTAALNGYDQGVDDARAAVKEATECGEPSSRPIFFAVDFEPADDQLDTVRSYFEGVASVLGHARTGAYGGLGTMQELFSSGTIAYGWQTLAWSYGEWDGRAGLRQIENAIDDGEEDLDEAVAADFGQWGASTPKAAPTEPKGVNGDDCSRYSPYDCRLGAKSQVARVVNDKGDNAWLLAPNASGWPILDGNGNQLGVEYTGPAGGCPVESCGSGETCCIVDSSTSGAALECTSQCKAGNEFKGFSATFNYGQERTFNGVPHVLAMSTSAGVAGWLPYKAIADWNSFKANLGSVSAKDDNLEELGCYEVKGPEAESSKSEFYAFEQLKVVRYAPKSELEEKVMNYTSYERGGDHKVLANMLFNVTIVSPTIDVFEAGTKFQRLKVPTYDHVPSLDVDLYKWGRCDHDGKDEDSYCDAAGQLKFIYGRVMTPQGEARYGWMALEGAEVDIPGENDGKPVSSIAAALVPSSNCSDSVCGALASCCLALPGDLASSCKQAAPGLNGNDAACSELLDGYRDAGYCK